ncbi:UbiD family decarboxylase [Engelhardtia mirabilis]|uniref:UbiD family decarboxylase n=1 Tax=Engelhardtia mirabilis TaxID=2528011 RepID=UPI0011A10AAE
MTAAPQDLRAFLDTLRENGELVEIQAPVSSDLEAAEIHRRVIAAGGPALLFRCVEGKPFPLVTNLFGTAARVERAFGRRPQELIARLAKLPEELMPPTPARLWAQRGLALDLAKVGLSRRRRGPVTEVVESSPQLERLPALRTWARDGGPFVTLPLVATQHPETGGPNLGMYRVQIFGPDTTGLHMQIGKGGGFHLAEAERLGRPLPVVINVGGPPAAILAAIAPLPENVPELLLGSLVLGRRLKLARNPVADVPLLADAEFAILGEVRPGERHPEGPFGDHYGYYSEVHDYPLVRVKALARRRDPIWPATVVGKPRQEDFYIGDFLQELLSPLFPVVMPAVRDLWSYGETGYHSLSAAVVEERYRRESMASAFRILGEGQLSLTKFLLVTDRPVDLRDFRATLTCILERADFRTDLFLFANLSMDSLDYAGPRVNEGGKGVLLGTGEKIRDLRSEFTGAPAQPVRRVEVFCPGALCVEVPPHVEAPEISERIARDPAFADWPLLVLTDDARRAARSAVNFLWTTFTRFNPSADIRAAGVELVHNHPAMTPPIVIDARMKAWYPEELFCDPDTAALVDRRWSEYFPAGGVEMGDSDRGHLD